MVIFKRAADVQDYLRLQERPSGFIPTMGALHAGHISLMRQARNEGYLAVCSIFVNPTQFNDREDFEKYPKSIDADIALLLEAGCDVLFMPDERDVYPHGSVMAAAYNFGRLEGLLEGEHRPGHFRGVGQVVGRLLEIIKPKRLYMGQKDYQQCLVIGKLIDMMGKSEEIELKICPTVREEDGLAMSSRNRRLTEPQRALASVIYQCLVSIQTKAGNSQFPIVQKECLDLLSAKGFEPEYVALADGDTLEPLANYDTSKKQVALIAARIGKVRLIDNMLITEAA
jgi:pantoate--beta-alanine ligase